MVNISKSFKPPRGSWDKSEQAEAPIAQWMNPALLHQSEWREGKGRILLGRTEHGQNVAYQDDRHLITIAGSRAGKTATMLIPNLRRYAGSMLVIDPKGELAEKTAVHRALMGHKVHILDPFGEVEKNGKLRIAIGDSNAPLRDKSSGFNPLDEFKHISKEDLWVEVAAFCDSLIISNERDPY